MPGRSGRSKGCINCRRKKRGCDQARPSCGRCIRVKERCEGYSDASFIAFEPSSEHISVPRCEDDNHVKSDSDPGSIVKLSESPSMLPMHDGLFVTYTVNSVLKGNCSHYTVLSIMDPLDPSNMLYRSSITALGTCFFGMSHGREDLISKGAQLYGNCLQKVNLFLTRKQDYLSADLIACVVCLGIFEFLRPTTAGGWVHHFNGLSQIFKMLGPAICSAMPFRSFFRSCRPSMIFASMEICKPSFLAQEAWKTIPWQEEGVVKSPIEFLFDIMTDLPARTYTQASISSLKDTSQTKLEMILEHNSKLKMSIEHLDQWMIAFRLQHGNCRKEMPYTLPVSNSEGQSIRWTSFYHYNSLVLANSVCFYYATNIYLLLLLVANKLGKPYIDEVAINIELKDLAINICKSVDYHLLHLHNYVGRLFLMYPLKMATRAFIKLEMKPEVTWIRDQFEKIGKQQLELAEYESGSVTRRNLPSMIYGLHASRKSRATMSTRQDEILRVTPLSLLHLVHFYNPSIRPKKACTPPDS